MDLSRRSLLSLAPAAILQPAGSSPLLYVGSYTNDQVKGISVMKFNQDTGQLSDMKTAAETPNPTFLAIHPSRKYIFAVNEIGNYEGQRAGSVCSFAADPETGMLNPLSRVSTKGPGPCHVSTDHSGQMLMIANYGGGSVASYKIGKDGRLSESVSFFQHEGKGTNPRRQEGPHAHCIYPSPGNKYAVSCDLGTDEVFVYAIDAASGSMKQHSKAKMADGAGPRHFAWHPDGKRGYVLNEIRCTVTVCQWDESKGELTPGASAGTLPMDYSSPNTTAEIRVHPNGKWLYASNRGKDDIALFTIEGPDQIRLAGAAPTQGQMPRNFNLDPSGTWLIAANQRSNNLVVFRIDQATGRLENTKNGIVVGAPVCLRWLA